MAGPDLSQISSNWKKLQAQLQTNKKSPTDVSTSSQGDGLKRKRPVVERRNRDQPTTHASRSNKKTRLSTPGYPRSHPSEIRRSRRMGGSASKDAEDEASISSSGRKHAELMKNHDLALSDLNAAYGPTNLSLNPAAAAIDDSANVNIGLHPVNKAGKYLSLDCEMVGTGPPPHLDDVLARVSLVNYHGQTVYDSYVLPTKGTRVEDYRTHVSGIRPQNLRVGVARPFDEVQTTVAKLLESRMLVGHALKNDLLALQLSHPRRDIRDTSRHAAYRVQSKGKPPALRNLAKSELGLAIQTGEHSSLEDARTAMALFRKEKTGFEVENRKVFGNPRKFMGAEKGGKKSKDQSVSEDEDEYDDEDDDDAEDLDADLDLLDGEDDGLEDGRTLGSVGGPSKKKRKKKKRTKRK